jgi:hypothetical protein
MLTVTVVDDLGALLVIATAYARSLHPFVLLLAGGLFALVAVLVRIGIGRRVICVPLSVAAWLGSVEVRRRPGRHRAGDRPGHLRCSGGAQKPRAGGVVQLARVRS